MTWEERDNLRAGMAADLLDRFPAEVLAAVLAEVGYAGPVAAGVKPTVAEYSLIHRCMAAQRRQKDAA